MATSQGTAPEPLDKGEPIIIEQIFADPETNVLLIESQVDAPERPVVDRPVVWLITCVQGGHGEPERLIYNLGSCYDGQEDARRAMWQTLAFFWSGSEQIKGNTIETIESVHLTDGTQVERYKLEGKVGTEKLAVEARPIPRNLPSGNRMFRKSHVSGLKGKA